MSLLSRLGKIVDGLGDSAANAADFVMDTLKADWGDTDKEGFAGFLDHIGNVFVATSGLGDQDAFVKKLRELGADHPDGSITSGLEALAGAVPKGVRRGVATPIATTMQYANRAYEDVVDRPLSYLMTIGSLYDDKDFMRSLSGMSLYERSKAVRHAAWSASEDRSFGDAFALAVGTKQITDQKQIDDAYGSDWFRTVSTVANLVPSFAADPVGIGLGTAKGLRVAGAAREARLFKDGYDVAKADELYQYTSRAKSVAQVRSRVFSSRNALEGPAYSAALFDAAKEGKDAFSLTLRGLLGDETAVAALSQRQADLAYKVGYLTRSRNALEYKWYGKLVDAADSTLPAAHAAVGIGSDFDRHWFFLLDNAVAETNSAAARLERTLAVQGTLDTIPRLSKTSGVRELVTRGEFYQRSPLAAPLRTVFGMNPQHVIGLHADDADVQIDRFMEKAGLPTGTRDAIRSTAIQANRTSPGTVAQAMRDAEDAVITHLANKHGVDPQVVFDARDAARAETDAVLNGSKYDAVTGNTIVKFVDQEGNLVERFLPVAPQQLANYKFLPDVRQLELEVKRAGKLIGRGPTGGEVADYALARFNRLWKPAALLSVRWPLRVIGEENVRAFSKIGVMGMARQDLETAKGFLSDKLGRTADGLVDVPYVARRPVVIDGETFAPSLMDRSGPAIEARLLAETASFNRMYGQEEIGLRNKAYESTQNWTQLAPGDHRYYDAWEHAVNQQLGRSRLAKRLLENNLDLEDAKQWLTHDPEGVRFAQTMPLRSRNPDNWVNAVADQITRYLPERDLQVAAAKGEFTADLAKRLIPDTNLHPLIHGQQLDEVIGGHEFDFTEMSGKVIDKAMTKLMQNPTIRLSRQPVYDALYRRRLTELVERAAADGREWTGEAKSLLERQARRYALGETRELLFDMAEHSRLGEALRFMAPFVDASREVITRWAGISMDNPLFVRRMQVLWQQPERAGFVFDGLGRRILPNGKVKDLDGKFVDPEGGRFVRFYAPEWAKDIPVLGTVIRGGLQFNKESVNTIVANPFGAGPLLQVAIDRLVDPNPMEEEKLKWLFPYGIQGGWSALAPTTVKEALKEDDSRSQMALTMHIWNDLATDWELQGGELGGKPKPTIAEAKEITRRIHQMLMVPSKFLSPVGVQTLSPFQPYIDVLRQLQAADPATAGQKFYDRYGVEFAALANSITQSNDKIPPTVAAYRERAKFADLVEKYPDLGAVIVGDTQGRFSDAVYKEQLSKAVGPNTSTKQRTMVPTEEFVRRPHVSAGWALYSKAMDAIDAARVARGLPNLQVKAAEDLLQAKQQIKETIAAKYPEWWDEYQESNPAKFKKKLDGLRVIAKDPQLSRRSEIKTLGSYFVARDAFTTVLRQRLRAGGSGALDARSNMDLAAAWGSVVASLTESDLVFSDLFYRYLDNADPSGLKNAA